ncbi:MAG: hypothetical protein VX938_00570, partial [Myxococcota bacterium]|nr:hypothetical protein [Myxococcota bacterium]
MLACAAWSLWACSGATEVEGSDGSETHWSADLADGGPTSFTDAEIPQPYDAGGEEPTLEGGFGWPCQESQDCLSELCLQEQEGEPGFCTQHCQQECPGGFLCKHQPQFGAVTFLCVTLEKVGCTKPCFHPWTYQGCGVPGALCAEVDGAAMCLDGCVEDADCPEDFTCLETLDPEGFPLGHQCHPDSGNCVCGTDIDHETDPEHCGGCGNVCAFSNAEALCVSGSCEAGPCESGWVDLNGDQGDGCE